MDDHGDTVVGEAGEEDMADGAAEATVVGGEVGEVGEEVGEVAGDTRVDFVPRIISV